MAAGTCIRCRGRGQIRWRGRRHGSSYTTWRTAKCLECNGTGEKPDPQERLAQIEANRGKTLEEIRQEARTR